MQTYVWRGHYADIMIGCRELIIVTCCFSSLNLCFHFGVCYKFVQLLGLIKDDAIYSLHVLLIIFLLLNVEFLSNAFSQAKSTVFKCIFTRKVTVAFWILTLLFSVYSCNLTHQYKKLNTQFGKLILHADFYCHV